MVDTTSPRVLVVEDSVAVSTFIEQTLANEGIDTRVINRGGDALAATASFDPHVILLDVFLDNISGLDICRRLKQDHALADIPVLFMTGLGDLEHKLKGFEAGGADYLVKPVEPLELVSRVKVHLSNRLLMLERDQLIETLKDLNEHQRQLTRVTSHDLRSPLSGIVQLASLISTRRNVTREDLNRFHSEIVETGGKMLELIEDLTILTADDMNRDQLQMARVSTLDHLHQCVQLFSCLATHKGIELCVDPATVNCFLDADPRRLNNVLNNLVSNALKFTRPGGKVQISASDANDPAVPRVNFHIEDNGIGMSEQIQQGLFSKNGGFNRAGTLGERSTGLGMLIIKQIVDQHRGTIAIESSQDVGTRVTISLPRQQLENHDVADS